MPLHPNNDPAVFSLDASAPTRFRFDDDCRNSNYRGVRTESGAGTTGTFAGTPTFGRATASGGSPALIRSAAVANATFIWSRWLE